jgi:hypothetical protein
MTVSSKPNWPRCQAIKRDGSACGGSVPKLPDGGPDELCAGHRRLERQRVLAEEIAARVASVDVAEVLVDVDSGELSDVPTDNLALALCQVSR